MSPDMFEELGWELFEGMSGTSPGATDPARGQDFTAAYDAEFGTRPAMPFMREVYDAVYVIALAAEKAGSTDSTAIRDALRDVSNPPGEVANPGVEGFTSALELIAAGTGINYSGAASEIDFDAAGDVPQGAIQVWEIEAGAVVESVRIFRVNLETGDFVEITQ
jgi:branched-chain amino acid transport system substrate-binding protein